MKIDIKSLNFYLKKNIVHLCGVYVFGSALKGETHLDSDVDIAVLSKNSLDKSYLWDVAQDLAVILGQDVDLIDLNGASTVFSFRIIQSGQRVLTIDEKFCEKFEDKIFRLYISLNEERCEILNDVKETGRVLKEDL